MCQIPYKMCFSFCRQQPQCNYGRISKGCARCHSILFTMVDNNRSVLEERSLKATIRRIFLSTSLEDTIVLFLQETFHQSLLACVVNVFVLKCAPYDSFLRSNKPCKKPVPDIAKCWLDCSRHNTGVITSSERWFYMTFLL